MIEFDDSRFQSVSGHLNVNHTSRDKRFQSNFSTTFTRNDNRQNGSALFTGQAFQLPPNAPNLLDEQGNINWADNFENPLRFLEQEYDNVSQNLVTNASLSYELLDGLLLKTTLGYNILQTDETRLVPLSSINPQSTLPIGASNTRSDAFEESWIVEPQLSYHRQIGEGQLNFLVGTTFQATDNELLTLLGNGYGTDLFIRDINAAFQLDITNNSFSEYRYNAIFTRLNYTWENKYILNLTGRRDVIQQVRSR